MGLLKRKKDIETTQKTAKKITAKQASDDFIKASREFEKSRIADIEKSRVLAWKVAIGAVAIAVANAIAIVGLTPLKEIRPYVIRYDNNTGATDIVTMFNGIEDKKQAEVSAKYFSAMYVNLMESYDWYTLQSQIDKLMLFSDKNLQQRISTKFARPDAPHKIYENSKRVEIEINNVSVIDERGLLQIRFTKKIVPTDGGSFNSQEQKLVPEPQIKKYIATLGYEYIKAPMTEENRLVNPFGFTVISYRVDEEFGG